MKKKGLTERKITRLLAPILALGLSTCGAEAGAPGDDALASDPGGFRAEAMTQDAGNDPGRVFRQMCEPSTKGCASFGSTGICNQRGTEWTGIQACPEDTFCVESTGSCAQVVCPPGITSSADQLSLHTWLPPGCGRPRR